MKLIYSSLVATLLCFTPFVHSAKYEWVYQQTLFDSPTSFSFDKKGRYSLLIQLEADNLQTRYDLPARGRAAGEYLGGSWSASPTFGPVDAQFSERAVPAMGVGIYFYSELKGERVVGGHHRVDNLSGLIEASLRTDIASKNIPIFITTQARPVSGEITTAYNASDSPYGKYLLDVSANVLPHWYHVEADIGDFRISGSVTPNIVITNRYAVLPTITEKAKIFGDALINNSNKAMNFNRILSSTHGLAKLGNILTMPPGIARNEAVSNELRNLALDQLHDAQLKSANETFGLSPSAYTFQQFIENEAINIIKIIDERTAAGVTIDLALLMQRSVTTVLGAVGKWLVSDPPDLNYKNVFDVNTLLRNVPGLSASDPATSYIREELLTAASIAGMVIANERYLGAAQNHDLAWGDKQWEAAELAFSQSALFSTNALKAESVWLASLGNEYFGGLDESQILELKMQLETLLRIDNPLGLTFEQLEAAASLLNDLNTDQLTDVSGLTLEQAFRQQTSPVFHWNNSVTVVPEPDKYAMLIAGLALLYWKLHKREGKIVTS